MDYTKIRQLIYRERKSLDEFDVLAEEKNVLVNAFLYDRLLKIGYLHPMYDYANEETLRIFNDVYFFMTLFFHDENPLAHYADYRRIPNPNQQKDDISQNRTWVELSMIYVILERWNRTKWFKTKIRHVKFFEIIKGEVENYKETWMGAPSEDIAYIISDGCELRDFIMSIDHDFPLCNIQEVIDSEVSLKSCLSVGTELGNVVNVVCKDEKQKLALIKRLLEPEKDHYGVLDSTICSAYRSLYELKSELTGEPLPEKLPFEKAGTFAIPMMPTPPSIFEYQSNEEDGDDEEVDEEIFDDREEKISKLTKKVDSLTNEVNHLTHENSELRKKIADFEKNTHREQQGGSNNNEEKEVLDYLEDWQKLSTRELSIFFAQALGVSFDPKLINQNQLANLAAMWTQPQSDTIRAKVGKLFKEESKVNNGKLDGYSPKTKDDALDVYYFIMRIAKHYSTITPQMNKILDNLNDIYNLGIVEKVDENQKEKQVTKKDIFDAIDTARKSGERKRKT